MKKSQSYTLYAAAAVLAALIAASAFVGHKQKAVTEPPDSAERSSVGPSYEQIVGAQQKHWGHGHTLSDPSPSDAAAIGSTAGYSTASPDAK